MPSYTYHCDTCSLTEERYIRLADFDKEARSQRCTCGAQMRKLVDIPVLCGLDTGPGGFMANRDKQPHGDGCPDAFTRRRVERNLGHSIGGGVWVPGLCRPGVGFDPEAVCHSREEVIQKAKKLGVAVRGPGINVEPTISEQEHKAREEEYAPSERALKFSVAEEIAKRGGKVSAKKRREIVKELQAKHAPAKHKPTPEISSIYPKGA